MKAKRKGFTLVELVVVIAVVAILAAVLIPTFVSLVRKANVSADTQLVRNLNTALASDGKEHDTMTEALQAAAKFGYDVGKINASATDNEILWDSENDVFCYLKDGTVEYIPETTLKTPTGDLDDVDYWRITAKDEYLKTNAKYSVYYTGTSKEIDTIVGFDAGEIKDITSITYTNPGPAQDVVIRTNSANTKVSINAPEDNVSHYGKTKEVNVIAVKPSSYHEYGEVLGKLNITKGRVVLEEKSNVSFINITNEAVVANVEVEVKENADYGRITAASQEILDRVDAKITVASGAKNTLVATSNTVAILNNIVYSDLKNALDNYTHESDVLELFTDIRNTNLATTAQYKIMMPPKGTLEGHGYQLSGNVSVYINKAGGTVNNVRFYDITNNAKRTAEQIDRYENDGAGTLTAIYGRELSGKATITNCIFDTNNWESIQITPVDEAEIIINNNIFKHSIKTWKENRAIHIQSSSSGKSFSVEIKNNDFYDTATTLTNQAIEVYYMNDRTKLVIENNYVSDYSNSVKSKHIAYLGLKKESGSGFDYIEDLNNYLMAEKPNN